MIDSAVSMKIKINEALSPFMDKASKAYEGSQVYRRTKVFVVVQGNSKYHEYSTVYGYGGSPILLHGSLKLYKSMAITVDDLFVVKLKIGNGLLNMFVKWARVGQFLRYQRTVTLTTR